MNYEGKLALVTGGNRGIGYYVCRDLAQLGIKVILAARNVEEGEAAAGALEAEGLDVRFVHMDVSDPVSIEGAARQVEESFGGLDILVNNAAVFVDHDWAGASVEGAPSTLEEKAARMDKAVAVNLQGPYLVIEAFLPLLKKSRHGRIVNISSILGQMNSMTGGYHTYRITKAALNAVTRIYASELSPHGILVNSVCPGWRRTKMGGPSAPLRPEEGNETIVRMATLPDGGPTGKFFRDGREMEL